MACTFHTSDSIHRQSFRLLSLPRSYHFSPSEVFRHQQAENEPVLDMGAEDMHQPLLPKSLKTMKLHISRLKSLTGLISRILATSLIVSFSFISIYEMLNFRSMLKGWRSEKIRGEYFSLFSFAVNSLCSYFINSSV